MLNSCASNVVVVNIDAGFNGGHMAGLIARRAGLARLSVAAGHRDSSAEGSEAQTGKLPSKAMISTEPLVSGR
jgi:hypothetical protein